MKKALSFGVGLALGCGVLSAFAATDYEVRGDLEVAFGKNLRSPVVQATALSGNVPQANITNALATTTAVTVTNTCVSATGKTNTYVFSKVGNVYVVSSISTSP